MKTITNPQSGAPIKDFLFKKMLYDLPVGETITLDDDLADAFLNTYGFLEEAHLIGKFVCKYGDYASDTKVAVDSHQRSHEARIGRGEASLQGRVFVTPQELADEERASRYEEAAHGIPSGEGTDKDGVGWYGPGLQEDRPGAGDEE